MSDFKATDFVQVLHIERRPDGEPFEYWRNALYIEKIDGNHCVIYTNGEKQMLHRDIGIRKPQD